MYNLDIGLLRTFLEVNKTRHFGKTAENLYLTQSAVSARIKQLEDILGVTLFQRHRNNIQLTPQGERLVPHADKMLLDWTQALQEVALPDQSSQIVIGAPQSLWESRLAHLPTSLLAHQPDCHVRAESLESQNIIRRLHERTLDFGIVFDPSKTDEVSSIKIASIELKLFSDKAKLLLKDVEESQYVMVDWGQGFAASHARTLPHVRSPKLIACDWSMALTCLTELGGFAYLPVSLVKPKTHKLYAVADAPIISREIYLCHHIQKSEDPLFSDILKLIQNELQNHAYL